MMSLIIDGEAVVLRPDGTFEFHALASSRARAACLIAFDILQIDGLGHARLASGGAARRPHGDLARAHLRVAILERVGRDPVPSPLGSENIQSAVTQEPFPGCRRYRGAFGAAPWAHVFANFA